MVDSNIDSQRTHSPTARILPSPPMMIDIHDNVALQQICAKLSLPAPITEVEEIEALTKLSWKEKIETGLSIRQQERFVEFFAEIGFFAKYKSYGTKYAAPFGYSLFDLENNAGFSIQVHESEKIEAFHILGTYDESFILLGTRDEWDQAKDAFISDWQSNQPENSSMVIRPRPGDLALVETLNTVHTVVGCILEEYATSSYDVVTRLHDQNAGDKTILPEQHVSVKEILSKAKFLNQTESLAPKRMLKKEPFWKPHLLKESNQSAVDYLVNLEGLKGWHQRLEDAPIELQVNNDSVTTLVALEGETMVRIGQYQQLLEEGDTTAIPPGAVCHLNNASIREYSRLSICEVDAQTAFADLR